MKAKAKILIGVVMLVGLLVALTGCSVFEGTYKGSVSWTSGWTLHTSGLDTTGGFPYSVSNGTKYTVNPGSYYFYYYLDDGVSYSSTWYVSYTVKKTYFSNVNFDIWCYWSYGPDITGLNIAGQTAQLDQANSTADKKVYSSEFVTVTFTKVDPATVDTSKFVKQ